MDHLVLDFGIPKECKAGLVSEGPGFEPKVEIAPVPETGRSGATVVEINAAGICSSDTHYMLNDPGSPKYPSFNVGPPGHEDARTPIKLGDNGDKECFCSDSLFTHLSQRDWRLIFTGTYQQYIVSPAKHAFPIPKWVSDYVADPIICSASTIYHSLVESDLKAGSWRVCLSDDGGVGIQGVQLGKALGLRLAAVDASAAKQVPDATVEVIKIADGKGAHGVFVTAPATYSNVIGYTSTTVGTAIVCIGLPSVRTMTVDADLRFFYFRNLTDTKFALDFTKRGVLRQISEVYPINKTLEAVERLKNGEVAGKCVVNLHL
ncbi:hypothetical protein AOQ84DRAFT_398224 [Glonium stellatum]|uniref:Alcohol dehydrogenase-like N-terminal domain-containing protein n=1 Tax=Glonium stellatum TaxID=574774 RepID=A0A8E2F0Z0_9PEZI|nr:hypothetical protein AOQ84DRAFT_398224 [Glonium stellatum]